MCDPNTTKVAGLFLKLSPCSHTTDPHITKVVRLVVGLFFEEKPLLAHL